MASVSLHPRLVLASHARVNDSSALLLSSSLPTLSAPLASRHSFLPVCSSSPRHLCCRLPPPWQHWRLRLSPPRGRAPKQRLLISLRQQGRDLSFARRDHWQSPACCCSGASSSCSSHDDPGARDPRIHEPKGKHELEGSPPCASSFEYITGLPRQALSTSYNQ